MRINLGAVFRTSDGKYCVAHDVKGVRLIEWHYYNALSDIVNDDYIDKEIWTIQQLCQYRGVRPV